MTSGSKVAVVTGGSSGIGLCTARALRDCGYRVFILCRRPYDERGLTQLCADVTQEASVSAAIEAVLEQEGKIDLLVNCAGFGISGAIEFTALADAKKQMDVNFFGMVNVNRQVIAHMRERKSGKVVNISSVAAPVAIPFQAYYSASKAAINAYTLALANELRPYGVQVCAIQPGDIATGFTAAREKSFDGDSAYGGRIRRSVERMEHDEQNGMSPEAAGRFICRVCRKKQLKPLYTIGFSYRCVCLLCKLLPVRLVNWIVGKLYAK